MMSTPKLVGLLVAWALAAAIVLTEFLDLIGVVESGQPSYSWAINGIALVVFVVLVAMPFLLRGRLVDTED